ncbi:putative trans-sialidase, Group II [Trypanosoma cruzi]|uniref:Trans-sialidase, putative n=2 Tax=Trypanosoma cruzi TaxID=5693 RepID=Q4CT07_TRYCC|nr:trans-sialidase, putative [Trypanosoma cruzi]EAN83408.1 trans-sialidase, putative [Trypanosoma cruzi]PWV03443.1 putative trans-sialidase, Group II [Trypanosoma cruzi]|eukprot:XP_805259.1 trans-sialidase [Trypanosoma cruzi strain CL Brener]
MLSRVAAVKAPRTHNRRRVTGSSGRRREGGEGEPQRPNMSRRVFASAVLLLLVVMCGSGGASNAVKSNSGNAQLPHTVDLFLPNQTLVVPKGGTSQETKRDAFASPSLVSAGGVIAAFAEGHMYAEYVVEGKSTNPSSDVVAEYIDSAWEWPTLVERVGKGTWRAHTVLGKAEGKKGLDVVLRPTTTMKGNKVFLLVGSTDLSYVNGSWEEGRYELKLVVGEVTNATGGEPSERIKWGEVQSPVQQTTLAAHKGEWTECLASGGSGVLMEDGTIVFSLMAINEKDDGVFSLIIYSKDNGSTWSLSEGTSHLKCGAPRITEWEGSLLMIVDCEKGQRVYESRDMGTTWTEAIGTLPGVWVNSGSGASQDSSLHVDALITATIEGRKVMLYTQRGYALGKNKANALHLWVTDNNRSFSVGPVVMDNAGKEELASTLLYSDGKLHLLQRRVSGEGSVISLSRLTEELKEIESVLSTWAQKDIFFSSLSIPTAGLVAVLSNASASDGTWNDEYLCLNATVTNATKVEDGFQLTEPNSRAVWPVNIPDDNVRHISLSHNFTLVASVTIEKAPSENTPLLTAVLGDAGPEYFMRLSYTADNKWETMFKGGKKTTTESRPWEAGKEYQVALMLQSNKTSVYIDGKSLGEEELPLTGETPLELFLFCFGACDIDGDEEKAANPKEIGKKPRVTVTNVFLYNRPLNSTEMSAIKDRIPVPTRAPEPQVKIAPKPVAPAAPAVPGPREVPAAPGRTANTQNAPAGRLTSAGNEGTARETGDGGANGDAGSAYGRVLLPLLLLGLWGFATA